jgi:hypothetical protein
MPPASTTISSLLKFRLRRVRGVTAKEAAGILCLPKSGMVGFAQQGLWNPYSCIFYGALLQCEHPNRSAFGHFRVFAGENPIEVRLHAPRVASPTRVHGNVLLAVDRKRCRWGQNT